MPKTVVIVDVEATCWDDDSFPREEMEIIEIGAVAVSPTGEIFDDFQAFIRPVRHPTLTGFCRALTGISQQDVDSAKTFVEVLPTLSAWLTSLGEYQFCSWGFYDRSQFGLDCAFHEVEYPFVDEHRNLKVEFAKAMGSRKKFDVGGALKKLGMTFEGNQHRGIDDARNIARIYAKTLCSK